MRIPAIALTTLLISISAFPQAATSTKPQTTSHAASIYVGVNGKIFAYSLQANGAVAVISGSPFTGPANDVVADSAHVYGTDGTNIATYARSANGALTMETKVNGIAHNQTPQGSVVSALMLDRTNSTLYAGELEFDGADNNSYAAFTTTGNGITFTGNNGINVDAGNELSISGNNRFFYGSGCYFADWDIFGYARSSNGLFSSFDPGGTYPAGPDPQATYCPISISASGHGTLAISYSSIDASPDVIVSIYTILGNGKLEQVTTSIKDIGNLASFVPLRFDPSGNYLAVGSKGGIQLFRLNADKTLTKLGKTVGTNLTIADLRWDNVGHLVAISSEALYVFTLTSGQLTWSGRATAQITKSGYPSLTVVP